MLLCNGDFSQNAVGAEVDLSLCCPACTGMTELNLGQGSWQDEPCVLICAPSSNYAMQSLRGGEEDHRKEQRLCPSVHPPPQHPWFPWLLSNQIKTSLALAACSPAVRALIKENPNHVSTTQSMPNFHNSIRNRIIKSTIPEQTTKHNKEVFSVSSVVS